MKKIIFLTLLATLGVANTCLAQGARAVMDFNQTFSYGATVKLDVIGGLDLGEVSLGSINGSLEDGSLSSVLAYIDPAHLQNLKSLPKPIFVDYVLVKFENGRFAPATTEDKNAVRLIFKYGELLPKPDYTPSIVKNDDRTIGYLDLQYTIFYPMTFEKKGKDIPVWQTAETIVDTVDNSISMKLVNFINKDDFSKLKSLGVEARLESVSSVWSDEKNKFVSPAESPWKWKGRNERNTLEVVWNADIYTTAAQPAPTTGTTSGSTMGQTQTSSFSISATTSGNITTVKWTETAGATSYKLSLTYPNGGVKDFNSSKSSIDLKNLPPGVYKATVIATSASGATLSTGSGQITN